MSRRGGGGAPLVWLGLVARLAACTQDVTAPGRCPAFCPSGSITLVDTVLSALGKDSSFRGFVRPHEAGALLAADLPGVVDGRPIFRTFGIPARLAVRTSDTTTGAVVGVDSLKLFLYMTRRDTATHNLRLTLYRLPLTIDSTTSFADLTGAWTDSVRRVNVDTLLARKTHRDSVTGDSVFVDTTTHYVTLMLKLDSAMAPYVPADSGKLAWGVRVSADSLASVALGSTEVGFGPTVQWFVQVDSAGKNVPRTISSIRSRFDGFVVNPPPVTPDSLLAVGGAPSARSLLRLALPRAIRDSVQIVRATLQLVAVAPVRGVAADSFEVEAHAVIADFGAKSPLAVDPTRSSRRNIPVGTRDTVRIEVTTLLQAWQADTTAPTTLVLRPQAAIGGEGASFAELRCYSSRTAYRPTLHLTYVKRFPFGVP